MCRAFLTGSRAYGTPRPDSDVDLVVFTDPETAGLLGSLAESCSLGSAGDCSDVSAVFGRLNLILLSNPRDFTWWDEGTRQLKAEARHRAAESRVPAVGRERAVEVLERLKAESEREFRLSHGEYARRRVERGDMVGIKLYDLVGVAAARKLWPPDFEALVGPLEQDPTDLSRYGVIADWCGENDEPELALAFRWVFKRPGTRVTVTTPQKTWSVEYLPPAVTAHMTGWNEAKSIPALMAQIYRAIEAARKDLD